MFVPGVERSIRQDLILARRSGKSAAGSGSGSAAACSGFAAAGRYARVSWRCTGPGSGERAETSGWRLVLQQAVRLGSSSPEEEGSGQDTFAAGRMSSCSGSGCFRRLAVD